MHRIDSIYSPFGLANEVEQARAGGIYVTYCGYNGRLDEHDDTGQRQGRDKANPACSTCRTVVDE